MTQSCATCKYGRFTMTKHNPPRPVKNGVCRFPPVELKLPECVTSCYGFDTMLVTLSTRTTWPDNGATCPVWEAEEHTGK
jgi:hypothetical protein